MKFHKYLLITASVLALFACEDPYKNSTYQIYNENPISTYLSTKEDFSEWVKVLKYSDMYNALNQADQDFTAFVPNNEAVQAFYQKMGVASVEELGVSYAKSMVLYSTVLDTISVNDFVNLKYTTNITGDKLSIQIDSTVAGEAIMDGNAKVLQMCISVSNGVIYVLGDVMKPLVETVYDRLAENSSYSILTQAMQETGWSNRLSVLADTVTTAGVQQITKRFYTVLAVSNETFAKDSIYSLQDLKTKLHATGNSANDSSALYQYVAYHILSSNSKVEDLAKFTAPDTTVLWNTNALNRVLLITLDSLSEEKYYLNTLDKKVSFVTEKSNVLAKNGFVHEINGYLPIWEPVQATVVWDLTDYSNVRSIVGSSLFQPAIPVTQETKVNVSNASCYSYELSASGVKGTAYSYLSYVTCKTNLKAAVHYDRLALNLGYMGNVVMKTPALIRGKYKVTLKFIYLTDHNFMRTMSDGNGGLMKISFDGTNFRNVSPYTTVASNLTGVYESTLYDEINFENTSSHDFKIVVMDPSASSNTLFSIQLDAITFTPIP
ncbi:MAG TPA: DUF5108 domain-containing protein [Bacteroidales bacterium]|nr:DUF5108 domain-containing protein [Bacteroidales bacterium]